MNSQGPLTIALIIATPGTGWGGMETHTADLANTLSTRGHTVHVLAHSHYNERFASPVYFHPLPVQIGRHNPWLHYRLRRLLRSIHPDIVHAQGNKAASLINSVRHLNSATVGTLHGTKRSHKGFEQLNGVIGVSRDITDTIAHANARLIHNGLPPVDTSDAESTEAPIFEIPAERPLLLAAGRLKPVKQFDRLIRAWVRADCGGSLVILGDGSQRAQLGTLIQELDVSDRILLPGHESRMKPWLQSATACIISSSREGFPYIMVEALMTGCPVLSTPVSGVREFLPEQGIAASDSIEDLATLIRTNLSAPKVLTDSQRGSFLRAREQLSLEAMVSKTEAFYRDLLASTSTER
ncbi:glycosyltransferase [Marinobacter sp.]|jgi:glycosyltransferase involved in cell wall biosynthesis|uniref:glycosyltransferase n=1 Tax=Marinobacter sp. TaxID=50741 RepID=UPI000C46AF7B|nr:glycosyltransferase [Marinobacter sp.]MBE93995.1 glycosyltransferase [Marinobacter sp.]|tara:strand:- start:17957 stop:19015 length:1059 start_codon:yes stop_codon:yes gene_type:complete